MVSNKENSNDRPVHQNQPLLTPYKMGTLSLPNRVVMAPMTRNRSESPDNSPIPLEGEYYSQRASAGLIVTGGILISNMAVGGVRVPGLFLPSHVEAWKRIVEQVHENGGRIFAQIAHQGSVSHPDLHGGALPVAPSAINPMQKVVTPNGVKETVTPHALTTDEVKATIDDYGRAAKNARIAGFDGVELHSSVIYLLPQFLNSACNQRTDQYGGSPENRARIVLESLQAMSAHWPKERVGIKIAPGVHHVGPISINEDTLPTFDYLVSKVNEMGIGHLVAMRPVADISATPAAVLQNNTYKHFRALYHGTLIANLNFDQNSANEVLKSGDADLVMFAKLFIANPDLPRRFALGLPLAEADHDTYYQGGANGYTSYLNAE